MSTVIGVARSNPVTLTCFFVVVFFHSILYFYKFIYLFIDIVHSHSKTLGLLNIALMKANHALPIELMLSVASHIRVFVFDNVPFDGHFV